MLYFNQFEKFNPKSGDVSHIPFHPLPAITERARELLRPLALEQILTIAKAAGYLIDRHFEDLEWIAIDELKSSLLAYAHEFGASDELDMFFDWDGGSPDNGQWIFKKAMTDKLDLLTAENSTVVDALKTRLEDWDDEGIEEDPNEQAEGKNYEFFAVLALILVADAQNWYFKHKAESLAGESGIQAMDAVCHAEHLQRKAEFKKCLVRSIASEERSKLKKIHSERGAMGATKRHAPARELRQWTLDRYKEGKWNSGNKAASDLKDKVLDHGKKIGAHLSESNAQRTIAEWINAYRARLAARPTR